MGFKVWVRVLAFSGLLLSLTACQLPVTILGGTPQESVTNGIPNAETAVVTAACSVDSPCDSGPLLAEKLLTPITVSGSPVVNPFEGCDAESDTLVESRVLEIINNVRKDHGLALLIPESRLENAALLHVLDISCKGSVSHIGSDGSTLPDRLARQGYPYKIFAENIYAGGAGTPEAAVDAMMASAPHRANILNGDFSEVGISFVVLDSSPYGSYYVIDFGAQ